MSARLELMLRASRVLRTPAGFHASGWADGYRGLEPATKGCAGDAEALAYETGWLAGAEAALVEPQGAA